MLKFIKYLELASVEDEIIELYLELYKNLMLKPDIKKYKFDLVLNSDNSVPNYIKLFCYFHLKIVNILPLKLIDQIMFIKDSDTKIYIDLFNNKIEKINEKEVINIDNVIKIGYSGTININLPKLQNPIRFDNSCKYPDADESTNIEHAILNSYIYKIDESFNFTDHNALKNIHKFQFLVLKLV